MMMMMDDTPHTTIDTPNGSLFATIFFDGEREIDLGTIYITPSMNFKTFQSIISQKIGISPHQITTYFTPFNPQNHRKRHPVTNKFNFSSAIPESNSAFFWVVLKRSRRLRRRRKPENTAPPTPSQGVSDENFVLLRRNPNLEYAEYENRLRMLEMEKERYLLSLNLNSNVYSDLSLVSNGGYFGMSSDEYDCGSSSGGGSENRVYCDVCLNHRMEGETVPFHWCKNDAVTRIYRSSAGPIGPPSKNKV